MNLAQAREIDLPAALATIDSGAACAFAVATARVRGRTPEQWARAVFEEGPTALRSFVEFGWRRVLGLRLGPSPSPDHVAGWTIAAVEDQPDSITLTAESRILHAHNVVAVDDAVVEWITVVRFERPPARPVWTLASPIHRLTIPYLLTRAAQSLGQRPPSS